MVVFCKGSSLITMVAYGFYRPVLRQAGSASQILQMIVAGEIHDLDVTTVTKAAAVTGCRSAMVEAAHLILVTSRSRQYRALYSASLWQQAVHCAAGCFTGFMQLLL